MRQRQPRKELAGVLIMVRRMMEFVDSFAMRLESLMRIDTVVDM